MDASIRTLAEYIGTEQRRILVEHGRCGASLGVHVAWYDETLDAVVLTTDRRVRRDGLVLKFLARGLVTSPTRGLLTTPRIQPTSFKQGPYVRCSCICLPAGHTEKRRIDKIGSLPVTFPKWKWGRSIDLPVVVF